ncbi:MAG TPA: cobalt ECF transporter T component CbiQ [Methanomicrobiales archaeon]|jgi:cobalt/nickel transport system permease protein|nr:cobalt ECF transporter T component CbiQ [Methanomicrobiales archaeon]
MSTSPVSSHIPDLNLITWYAERQESFLSRVSPWTKVALLVLVVVAVTVVRNPVILLGLYLAVLALYILARLPVGKLFGWYLFPLIFVLSLVGILAWTQPGTPVMSFVIAGFHLTLTDQGILLVLNLSEKTLTTVTFSLLFLMTTRYEYLTGMISRIFPSPLDQIFLMAYRFFFLTLDMVGSILKAVRSRGGGIVRGITTHATLFAEVFGLVFIRSFDRAERVQKAMLARGYTGSFAGATRIPRPGIAEIAALVLCALALVAGSPVASAGGW